MNDISKPAVDINTYLGLPPASNEHSFSLQAEIDLYRSVTAAAAKAGTTGHITAQLFERIASLEKISMKTDKLAKQVVSKTQLRIWADQIAKVFFSAMRQPVSDTARKEMWDAIDRAKNQPRDIEDDDTKD